MVTNARRSSLILRFHVSLAVSPFLLLFWRKPSGFEGFGRSHFLIMWLQKKKKAYGPVTESMENHM